MKTIANIIINNSQNIKSEHLLVVIITIVFKEENSVSAGFRLDELLRSRQHWSSKTATG